MAGRENVNQIGHLSEIAQVILATRRQTVGGAGREAVGAASLKNGRWLPYFERRKVTRLSSCDRAEGRPHPLSGRWRANTSIPARTAVRPFLRLDSDYRKERKVDYPIRLRAFVCSQIRPAPEIPEPL